MKFTSIIFRFIVIHIVLLFLFYGIKYHSKINDLIHNRPLVDVNKYWPETNITNIFSLSFTQFVIEDLFRYIINPVKYNIIDIYKFIYSDLNKIYNLIH